MPASRSLIALLLSTVVLFALYFFAFKGNSSNSSTSTGAGQFQPAINQAHQAVQTSGANDAASGNVGTPGSASSTPASGGASAPTKKTASSASSSSSSSSGTSSHAARKPVVHLTPKVATHSHAALVRLSTVQRALTRHKIVVMLFYNPRGTDDQAVKQALQAVPTLSGQVVKLSIPLSESANFTPVTAQAPVNFSPTVVLISPHAEVQEITGLTDRFVISQLVIDDAFATR